MTIGIVVRVNNAAGGVKVDESAPIGAVKRGGSGLRGRIFGGVGIGTADRTVWLYTTGAVNETTPTPEGFFSFDKYWRPPYQIVLWL